jgi:hypothetical protein
VFVKSSKGWLLYVGVALQCVEPSQSALAAINSCKGNTTWRSDIPHGELSGIGIRIDFKRHVLQTQDACTAAAKATINIRT